MSDERVPQRNDLECIDCGKRTSVIEARLRKFNTGRCGYCGGDLQTPERLAASREGIRATVRTYGKTFVRKAAGL